jgi:hypothetical protein
MVQDSNLIYLCHHGIQGQKWGVRRFQNADGSLTELGKQRLQNGDRLLKAGSNFYRVDLDPNSKTYDNKKYLSTNEEDHEKWLKYLGEGYGARGRSVNSIMYTSLKDIWVASDRNVGKVFAEEFFHDPKNANMAIRDTNFAVQRFYRPNRDGELTYTQAASLNFAAQTETGKRLAERMMDLGYDAVEDAHGKNTSKDPIILLDPDRKIKKENSSEVTRYVKKQA